MLQKRLLENGCTLVYRELSDASFFKMNVCYELGSSSFPSGHLHFFEHCAFASPLGVDINSFEDHLHEELIFRNATTQTDQLNFFFDGLSESWEKIVEVFCSTHNNKEISDSMYHKEKKRIKNELLSTNTNDDQYWRLSNLALYKNASFSESIIGTKGDISNCTLSDIQRIADYVSNQGFTIYVQGSVSFDRLYTYINNSLSKDFNKEKIDVQSPEIVQDKGLRKIDYTLKEEAKHNFFDCSFFSKKTGIKNFLFYKTLSCFLSSGSASDFSKKLSNEIGLYDYSVDTENYSYGTMLNMSFDLSNYDLKKFSDNFLSFLNVPCPDENKLNVIKKGIRYAYLAATSSEGDRFDIEMEQYFLFGKVLTNSDIEKHLDSIDVEYFRNSYDEFLSNSYIRMMSGKKPE